VTPKLSTVLVVDDDASMREALSDLFQSIGLRVEVFASTQEFIKNRRPEGPGCLVLDVRLPGKSGLDFQQELNAANINLPIVFLTGHGDIPMSVRAMKAGAVELLTKPFREQDLLDAVQTALERDRANREDEKLLGTLRQRLASLTARTEYPGIGRSRSAKQANRVRDRNKRGNRQSPSHQSDAQDASVLSGRSDYDGHQTRASGKVICDPQSCWQSLATDRLVIVTPWRAHLRKRRRIRVPPKFAMLRI